MENKSAFWISETELMPIIEEYLRQGREARFTVTGQSMWPFLCHGRDQVIVESVDVSTLKKGDVILFEAAPQKYMLHRITRRFPNGFETTGDGNFFRDGKFEDSCVIARVVEFVRMTGKNGEKHIIKCDALHWKVIFRVWMWLFPVRRYLFKVWFMVRPMIRTNKA